jgi:NAD(P)-dependent dehydrogenase (short-subunit alcohol dehydrogenase family)
VTGGATGLGLQMATALAEAGANVVICSRKLENCEEAAHAIEKLGVKALAYGCDVTKPDQVEALKEATMQKFGRVDALINNAGRAWVAPVEEMPLERWQQVLDLNITAPFLCAQAFGREMIKVKRGKIINIASIAGLVGRNPKNYNSIAYGTSKGAIVHLTKQQAAELGDVGIRVNCVAPGPVLTEMAKLVHSTAIIKDYFDAIPLNRYGSTTEIANTVVFLCSAEASFINGQTIAVDGGFDASGVGIPTLRKNRAATSASNTQRKKRKS